ncbi:MAG: helix-turn-helix domain-containing protein [Clostridia bacterium]|nr:helix-turn-helix domain-containing protein [Clostridia bacterium]
MDKLHSNETDKLFKAILSLKNIDECYDFFEDICTIKELRDLSLRLEVASMLKSGKSYQEITRETGVSAATICRVNKCLNYGKGYVTVLQRDLTEDNK